MVIAAGTIAACADDTNEEPGSGSSSGNVVSSSGNPSSSGNLTSSSSGEPQPECSTPPVDANCNIAKCTADLGAPAICNAGKCVALTKGDDCKAENVFGAKDDDNAIWIAGMTGFITGDPDAPVDSSGMPQRNSIELAVDEINAQGGIPAVAGSGKCARKLAAIVCDDGGWRDTTDQNEVSVDIAKHLVNDLGITSIVGANWSGPSISIAEQVTLPAKALLFAPGATAIKITSLDASPDGNRLFWRTAPSDVLQSAALLQVLPQVAPTGTVKVAIVNAKNAYGTGLGDALALGSINGHPMTDPLNATNFVRVEYDDAVGQSDYDAVKTALVALKPDVIMMIGTNEIVGGVLTPYEATNPTKKPIYLVSDGVAVQELWSAADAKPELATRIRGTVPGATNPLTDNFFAGNYKVKYPTAPDEHGNPVGSTLIFGMGGCYDATYLLGYAMIASQTADTKTFTGNMLSQGLAKTVSGINVDVGVGGFNAAATALAGGNGINFTGTTGPLDFDVAKGEAASDLIVWCVRKNPNTNSFERYDNTKQTFSASSNELSGTFLCPTQ